MMPLAGLKVLDLSRALAGPYSTMILGDLGAEVIKAEPLPRGEMSRGWGPIDRDMSVYFLSTNRNKKGLGLDFRDPEGAALLRRLALKSDIVVENFRVGTMEKMGLGYDSLAAENPALIMASISGYGRVGPARDWAGFDQIAQGHSGFMSLTGSPETGATRVGIPIGDMVAGMWLVTGILSAVIERGRTGRGQHVDVSLLAGLMALLSVQGQRYLNLGEVPTLNGNAHPTLAPYGTFETADGPINLAPATEPMWKKLCELLGLQELTGDPRFLTNAERIQNRDALKALLESRLREKTRSQWTELFVPNGIPAGPINSMPDVFADAQVKAAGIVEQIAHPVLGEISLVGSPVRLSAHAGEKSTRLAPPLLGQHSAEVLRDLGIADDEIQALRARGVISDEVRPDFATESGAAQ